MKKNYHIFRVYDYKGGELSTSLNLTREQALHEYCRCIYEDVEDIVYPITPKILFKLKENIFSIYAGNYSIVMNIYEGNTDGTLSFIEFSDEEICNQLNKWLKANIENGSN